MFEKLKKIIGLREVLEEAIQNLRELEMRDDFWLNPVEKAFDSFREAILKGEQRDGPGSVSEQSFMSVSNAMKHLREVPVGKFNFNEVEFSEVAEEFWRFYQVMYLKLSFMSGYVSFDIMFDGLDLREGDGGIRDVAYALAKQKKSEGNA